MGLSVVMIVIVAVIGIVLVLGCLGAAGFFFVGMPVAAPSPPPVVAPLPVPMHVVPVEELTIDSDPDTPDDQPPASELRKGEPRKDDTTPEQPADPP